MELQPGLAGSVGDTSPGFNFRRKSLSVSCAAIVDYLPEEPPSSMSAVDKCPKKQQNRSQNV